MGMTDSQFKAIIRMILSECKTIDELEKFDNAALLKIAQEKKEELFQNLQSMLED